MLDWHAMRKVSRLDVLRAAIEIGDGLRDSPSKHDSGDERGHFDQQKGNSSQDETNEVKEAKLDLLAKTEDVRSESPIEEDNWLAAVEWGDSLGVDVISSSLGYFVFDNTSFNHTYSQMDGKTTVVSKAAALAARRGIVVASAMGNSGSAAGSMSITCLLNFMV